MCQKEMGSKFSLCDNKNTDSVVDTYLSQIILSSHFLSKVFLNVGAYPVSRPCAIAQDSSGLVLSDFHASLSVRFELDC